jgi:WhiB family redox-sensing transcriptional regulator
MSCENSAAMIDLADASFDYWRAMIAGADVETLADRLNAMRPPWMARSACRGNGTGAYFPGRGEPVARAKAVCAACEVQAECLAYALADPELAGVWGGTSAQQRRALRRTASRPLRPSGRVA